MTDKKTICVGVHGCDDSTYVRIEVSPEEEALLERLSKLITKAGGGCKPTMGLGEEQGDTWPNVGGDEEEG